jgi:dynein heavy chain
MHEYLNLYAEIPFKVLQFLFTEINYGGRVTDGKDRRLINNLVLNFCNDTVVNAGYSFSPDGIYTSTCDSRPAYLCFWKFLDHDFLMTI